MRRRDFMALLGGAAAGWPRLGHEQQSDLPLIGYLSGNSRTDRPYLTCQQVFQRCRGARPQLR
jgi:hypothetical protein